MRRHDHVRKYMNKFISESNNPEKTAHGDVTGLKEYTEFSHW